MATSNDVTDPSDWIGTPLAALEPLDHALRCQVCKEFLTSPMITTCAHTFCSLCIRRCLSADGKCPLCRASDQPNQLRKNSAMEEAVKVFLGARPDVLGVGRARAEQMGDARRENDKAKGRKKRKVQETDLEVNGETTPRKTRTRSRREGSGLREKPAIVDDSEEEAHCTESEQEETRPDDGLVACPICQKRMPEERVFGHLEIHSSSKEPTASTQLGQPTSLPTRENEYKPLPGLNYSMLTENALRKRMQSLGIPSSGTKMTLQRRHTEWVNIWNANCDSTNPRSRRDLLRDLDTWEKSQNRPQQTPPTGAVMDKEFDGQAWASSHGNDFQDLIAKAKSSRKQRRESKNPEEAGEHETAGQEPSDEKEGAPRTENTFNDTTAQALREDSPDDVTHLEPSPIL